ncbi:MAG: DUF4386 domain-containing protein [ANME-2 cluster archaeon]|nr:MAG: DUF4386 domain-containing protein [ANME-2 cluster archaeon]
MNPRNTARIVGILFIIGTVAGISSFVGAPPLDDPDYLVNIAANGNLTIVGALCVLVMGIALAPVPVFLFPILKKVNESLALGYVVFRVLEAVSFIVTAISWLLLLTLSQEFVLAGAPDASYYQTLGTLLLAVGSWVDPILVIVFSISALILNYLLYKSILVPRWLSGWGFVGGILHLAEGLLDMFGLLPGMPLGIVFFAPIALQEMVYAVWLIVKGFNTSAIAPESPSLDG